MFCDVPGFSSVKRIFLFWLIVLLLGLTLVFFRGAASQASRIDRGESSAKPSGFAIPAPPMRAAREGHTAILLPNGSVLVAGGRAAGAGLKTAQLFNPATGVWTDTANTMHTARYGQTALLLANGMVMLIGGQSSETEFLSTVEIYNPTTNSWLSPADTPRLNGARAKATATLLFNGKILLTGGQSSPSAWLRTTELYDPAANVWTTLSSGDLNEARGEHSATLISDGRVMVTGGQNNGGTLKSTELFDPAFNRWRRAGDLNAPRRQHTATLLPTGFVLVTGGLNGATPLDTAELFNKYLSRWSNTASLGAARRGHTATLLPNGLTLIVGGQTTGGSVVATAQTYNAVSQTWGSAATATGEGFGLVAARADHAATLLNTGGVLFTGGSSAGGALASAEAYEYAFGNWSPTKDTVSGANTGLNTGRYRHSATLLADGRVLIAGGLNNKIALSSTELYDPATGVWTSGPDMGTRRADHTATLLPDGSVLVVGGQGGDDIPNGQQNALASAERYDPRANAWMPLPNLRGVRSKHTATLLPGNPARVLVVGGDGPRAGLVEASVQIFNVADGTWSDGPGIGMSSNIPYRYRHTATLLPDGRVLLVGGLNDGDAPLNRNAYYNPKTNSWAESQSFAQRTRFGHTATLLPNGKVLVVNGRLNLLSNSVGNLNNAEVFDPVNDQWESVLLTTSGARFNHTATLLPTGKVLVTGGFFTAAQVLQSISTTETFDPNAPTGSGFRLNAQLAESREGHSAILLTTGQLLVTGGRRVQGPTAATLNRSDFYDTGLGIRSDWRSTITYVSIGAGDRLTANGIRFRGISEAGGSGGQNPAGDHPTLQLRSLANDQITYLSPESSPNGWANNTFVFRRVSTSSDNAFAPGPALLTVITNGIAGNSLMVANDGSPLTQGASISGRVAYHNGEGLVAQVTLTPTTDSPAGCSPMQTVFSAPNGEYTFPGLAMFPSTPTGGSFPTITCPINQLALIPPGAPGAITTYPAPVVTGGTAVCTPASGTFFPVGTTAVRCSVTNQTGTARCGFNLTLSTDSLPAVLVCPPNQTLIVPQGSPGLTVNYQTPVVSNATVTCNPPSGTFFDVGTRVVDCRATNNAGTTGCTFTIRIGSTPTIVCPGNQSITVSPTSAGANVNYQAPTATNAVVSCNPAPGSFFRVGTTTVNCTAQSNTGNSSCSFSVSVNTGQPISCPAGQTVSVGGNANGRNVTYSTPTVNGAQVSCNPPSGAFFPRGTTPVTCTANYPVGTASCAFNITVVSPPQISCPANQTVTVGSGGGGYYITNSVETLCGAFLSYQPPAVSGASVRCSPLPGTFLPLGTTSVTCSATNTSGSSSCNFAVQVNPPQQFLYCPPDRIVDTGNNNGTNVTYSTPFATCASVVCSPPSGSFFTVGTTRVTCNTVPAVSPSCSFNITVRHVPIIMLTEDNAPKQTSAPEPFLSVTTRPAADAPPPVSKAQQQQNSCSYLVRPSANFNNQPIGFVPAVRRFNLTPDGGGTSLSFSAETSAPEQNIPAQTCQHCTGANFFTNFFGNNKITLAGALTPAGSDSLFVFSVPYADQGYNLGCENDAPCTNGARTKLGDVCAEANPDNDRFCRCTLKNADGDCIQTILGRSNIPISETTFVNNRFTALAPFGADVIVTPNAGNTLPLLFTYLKSPDNPGQGVIFKTRVEAGAIDDDVQGNIFANPSPQLAANALSRTSAPAGSEAFDLIVTGSSFSPTSVLRWNELMLPTLVQSATQLSAIISAEYLRTPGTAQITVFTPEPGGGVSAAALFTVQPINPTISLTPASLEVAAGGNQSLTVSLSAAQTAAVNIALASSNTALATVPASVTIPANATSAGFNVSGVTAGGPVTITATLPANLGGGAATAGVQVINVGLEADVAPRPNGNGSVSLTDWVQIGRFVSGADTVTAGGEFQRADCAPRSSAGNGGLSLTDWVQAGRYAAGLDEPMPAAGPTAPTSAFSFMGSFMGSFTGSFTGEDFATQLLKRLNWPDARTLRLRTDTEKTGAESSVQIEMDVLGGENAVGFSLSFDAARLRLLSASTEIGQAILLVNRTQLKDGKVGIALALNAGETLPPGKHLLVTLRFAPLSPWAGSGEFSFGDAPINREAVSAAADSLPLNFARDDERPLTVVSAADFNEQRLARDSIAVAIGKDFHDQADGTQVWLLDAGGVEHTARLFSVSPEQITFQVPAEAALGSARLSIRTPSAMLFATRAEIVETAPAVFSTTQENQRWPAAMLLRIHSDGRVSYDPLSRLAFGEEEQLILVLFGTGLRHHQGRVSAQIGAIQLPVLYAGAQGDFAGLDQINLLLPRSLAGSGETILKLSVDGQAANPLRLVIN